MTTRQWAELQRQAEAIEKEKQRNMTAVEWLMERYLSQDYSLTIVDFDTAKEMHKQEIIDAFNQADAVDENNKGWSNAEQYYQETFK